MKTITIKRIALLITFLALSASWPILDGFEQANTHSLYMRNRLLTNITFVFWWILLFSNLILLNKNYD